MMASFMAVTPKSGSLVRVERCIVEGASNASVSIDRESTWTFAGTPSLKGEKNVKTSDRSKDWLTKFPFPRICASDRLE